MEQKERLIEILSRYFQIGDSYAYNLTRDKEAFAVGTMSLDDFEEFDDFTVSDIADHLLANGVIVPPCKVGQKVYALDLLPDNCKCADCDNYYAGGMGDISECEKTKDGYRHHKCIEIHEERAIMQDILSWLIFDDFGETVFLTREEAEKALAERGKE